MNLSIVILSGGRSKRFQRSGTSQNDKALELVKGKRMLERVIDVAYEIANEVSVVVRDEEQASLYKNLLSKSYPTLNLLTDIKNIRHSPLAAIIAGARETRSHFILALPCDTPFIRKGILEYMIGKAEGVESVLPLWPDGKVEPLIAVYKRESVLLHYPVVLQLDRRRPDDLLRGCRTSYLVDLQTIKEELDPNLASFINVNYPEDLNKSRNALLRGSYVRGDRLLHPNNVSIKIIEDTAEAIMNFREIDYDLLDKTKDALFWLALLVTTLSKNKGDHWLEIAGRSFELEGEYFRKEEVKMISLHAIFDALWCWKKLGYKEEINRTSRMVDELKKYLDIDFKGKLYKEKEYEDKYYNLN